MSVFSFVCRVWVSRLQSILVTVIFFCYIFFNVFLSIAMVERVLPRRWASRATANSLASSARLREESKREARSPVDWLVVALATETRRILLLGSHQGSLWIVEARFYRLKRATFRAFLFLIVSLPYPGLFVFFFFFKVRRESGWDSSYSWERGPEEGCWFFKVGDERTRIFLARVPVADNRVVR